MFCAILPPTVPGISYLLLTVTTHYFMDTLIDWGSFLIQIINFAVVAFVLRRFFFVPYLQFLDEEAAKRKDLEEKLAKQSHILEEAHNQAANLVDQAKVDARMVASEIVDNARREGKELAEKATKDAELTRSKGFADIAGERISMESEMKKRVIDVALALNAKVFGESKAHREFLETQSVGVKF
jgi:F-type H+-transporting ATPase subunit b